MDIEPMNPHRNQTDAQIIHRANNIMVTIALIALLVVLVTRW
jgi:hypothetical protein